MLDTFIIAGCSNNFGFGFFFVSFSKLVESLNVILKGLNFQTDENSLGFFLSSYRILYRALCEINHKGEEGERRRALQAKMIVKNTLILIILNQPIERTKVFSRS